MANSERAFTLSLFAPVTGISLKFFFPGGPAIDHAPYWEQPFSQPYFDNSTKREVVTTVGQSAYLYCRVRNLGDRAVSASRSLQAPGKLCRFFYPAPEKHRTLAFKKLTQIINNGWVVVSDTRNKPYRCSLLTFSWRGINRRMHAYFN